MEQDQGAADESMIIRTAAWVRSRCQAEGSHDWFHIERVWNLSRQLMHAENLRHAGANGACPDSLVVELAALLHDIADAKYHGGDETIGPRLAREWLLGLAAEGGAAGGRLDDGALSAERIARIVHIIATMSFRHGFDGFVPNPADREFAIVRDADRLDAMGAIGIARAFAYGGAKGRPLHDPDRTPEQFANRAAYLASGGGSLNHFYEKLFLLKDGMLTASGKVLAARRHGFMEEFVARFLEEWQGET